MKIPKQQYAAEFMQLAVKGVNYGMIAGAASKELGLGEQTLRNWAMAAEAARSTVLEPRWLHRNRWMLLKGGFWCLADRDRSAVNMTQSCDLKTIHEPVQPLTAQPHVYEAIRTLDQRTNHDCGCSAVQTHAA